MNPGQDWSLRPGGASVNPAPPLATNEREGSPKMTWIHAVKRQGVIAMLSIGLTVPAVGLAGAALADSQGKSAGTPASAKAGSQGAAASNSHGANNGKDNGNNGNGKNAEA